MLALRKFVIGFSVLCAQACGGTGEPGGPVAAAAESAGTDEDGPEAGSDPDAPVTLLSDVEPITQAEDALRGVVIPPFVECQAPKPGEAAGKGPDGKVCTPTSIAGCTEPGRYYPDYGNCKVVLTQRPFGGSDPANLPAADDPRLGDAQFMQELAWVTEQVEASACVCCHDSRQNDGTAAQWDVHLGPIWTDTISDSGIALFTGLADSRALGAYPAEDNNGFDRSVTGIPTTDVERMKAFFLAELARRDISQSEAAKVTPFGGPVYRSLTAPPVPCSPGEGVSADGKISWNADFPMRYVYILEQGSENPGVPPNLDRPEGTIWRLDVMADQPGVSTGITYGETPAGTFQAIPARGRAPALERGKTYHLHLLYDVGLALTNCLFTYEG